MNKVFLIRKGSEMSRGEKVKFQRKNYL